MVEQWKMIILFPEYMISNYGRVYSHKTHKILSQKLSKAGYKEVSLYNGKRVSLLVHRLVGDAFLENTENLFCINHKDGCKTNNYVENLEWCTTSDNVLHSYRMGLHKSKLSVDDVLKIKEMRKQGEYYYQIAEKFGVSKTLVIGICNGKKWSWL
jgi:hypothetical protein